MRHILSAALCLSAALPAAAQDLGMTWDWQVQRPLDLSRQVQVLALDPDEVNAGAVAALRGRGVTAVCYISVGTHEDWRPDARRFPPEVLGNAYEGWEGERFLDIRRIDILLPLMAERMGRCRTYGFTAIEADNIDLHINDTGFAITEADVVAYVSALADMAHDLGLRIGQKNAPDLTAALAPHLDFAMTENCLTDGWCDEVAIYAERGQAILAAEYDIAPADRPALCARAAEAGLSLIFKTRDLNREGARCR